mmetsp:Transcript_8088/g.34038  ORF Transcript_8088/g.34038 Transcript_8088/m.34038 type:complete len:293 (+) Transcript_8088:238-1116(+)
MKVDLEVFHVEAPLVVVANGLGELLEVDLALLVRAEQHVREEEEVPFHLLAALLELQQLALLHPLPVRLHQVRRLLADHAALHVGHLGEVLLLALALVDEGGDAVDDADRLLEVLVVRMVHPRVLKDVFEKHLVSGKPLDGHDEEGADRLVAHRSSACVKQARELRGLAVGGEAAAELVVGLDVLRVGLHEVRHLQEEISELRGEGPFLESGLECRQYHRGVAADHLHFCREFGELREYRLERSERLEEAPLEIRQSFGVGPLRCKELAGDLVALLFVTQELCVELAGTIGS